MINSKNANVATGEPGLADCREVAHLVASELGMLPVYQGHPLGEENLAALRAYLSQPEIAIRVSLGLGHASATVWGCDLTCEYVTINGKYTT